VVGCPCRLALVCLDEDATELVVRLWAFGVKIAPAPPSFRELLVVDSATVKARSSYANHLGELPILLAGITPGWCCSAQFIARTKLGFRTLIVVIALTTISLVRDHRFGTSPA